MRSVCTVVLVFVLISSTNAYPQKQQEQPPKTEIPGVEVDVVSPTPLPGVELARTQVAAPIQVGTSEDLTSSGALDLSDFLNRRFMDVHITEMQGNPFQTDVHYRGYAASPLLGTPQGLSVYMDGVRLNQPFGEVVNWDLIPRVAISSMTLMPGSNPLFGLNSLGGALSLQTKSGLDSRGGSLRALYGSHVRRSLELEYGGSNAKGWNWYLAGNRFGENGWRTDSHTDIRQFFGKFGRQDARSDVSLTLAYANNSLNGNALQENRFLDRDYSSVYTKPDNTHNRASFVNLAGKRSLSERLFLSGNIYYRDIRSHTLNGDINEASLDQSVYQPSAAERTALANAGYTGFPTSGESAANTAFPFWRCIGHVLLEDEPAEKCNGLVNRSSSGQHNFGLSGQFTLFGGVDSHKNQLTAGAAFDRSRINFRQSTQLGYLNPDRSITGLPAFADGVTGGNEDGVPFDTRVDLESFVHTWSLYGTDTFSLGDKWHLTASARFNRSTVDNGDRITPGGGPGSLEGQHAFHRLNPALGITFSPRNTINLYFGYSEGSRAPTSIELGCADPNEPCRLPNAMAGDPPLEQVVTRTWETGIRSGDKETVSWTASYFLAENSNDILFVTSPQSGFGYFKNFGKTRRQGLELALQGKVVDRVTIGGGYTFLDATYQSDEEINGAGNSSNLEGPGLEGAIHVGPGDRLPLTPEHMFKAFVEYQAFSRLSFDLGLIAVSSSLARGNENNQHQPDGRYYFGNGKAAGYGVVNAGTRFVIHPKLELFAELTNVLNKRYATAAQLGSTGFTGTGSFVARALPAINGEFPVPGASFLAPGAPRMFSVGTRVRF